MSALVHGVLEFIGAWTLGCLVIGGCLAAYGLWSDRRDAKRRDARAVDWLIERSKCPSSWVHVGKEEN